ncbi:MAG: hypothetical protein QOC70_2802, partial [Verrucomicrobiota bacterium]
DRSTTALMMWAARSSGRTDANAPACRPTGVRRAVMIAARLCIEISRGTICPSLGAKLEAEVPAPISSPSRKPSENADLVLLSPLLLPWIGLRDDEDSQGTQPQGRRREGNQSGGDRARRGHFDSFRGKIIRASTQCAVEQDCVSEQKGQIAEARGPLDPSFARHKSEQSWDEHRQDGQILLHE